MSSDMNSMLKLILEEQEREIAWSPTSYQGAHEPSTSREYQPCGYYAQGSQHEECERYHPWNMECEDQIDHSSQISKEEEDHNLLMKLLDDQEKGRIERNMHLDFLCTKMEVVANQFGSQMEDEMTHVVTQPRKEKEEIPIDDKETSSKEEATLSDIQEEEERINVLEELFGYPSMEVMNAKLEDDAQREWILPTKEEPHVNSIAKKEVNKEEPKERQQEVIEEPQQWIQEEESPMDKPFDVNFGLISTKEVSIEDPRRIPFEEIRMKTFKGWFYDEYEPGDPWLHLRNLNKKSS